MARGKDRKAGALGQTSHNGLVFYGLYPALRGTCAAIDGISALILSIELWSPVKTHCIIDTFLNYVYACNLRCHLFVAQNVSSHLRIFQFNFDYLADLLDEEDYISIYSLLFCKSHNLFPETLWADNNKAPSSNVAAGAAQNSADFFRALRRTAPSRKVASRYFFSTAQ